MTQTPTKYDRYLSDHSRFRSEDGADAPSWLHEVRDGARDRFSELGMPTARRGNEKWKYTNVGPIANADFARAEGPPDAQVSLADLRRLTPWNEGWTNLVFVDGHYSHSLSSTPRGNGVRAGRIADAIEQGDGTLQRHLTRYASSEDDSFTALNTAFLQDGAYVRVPEGETLGETVHISFVSTEREHASVSHPRVLVVADRGSKATVVESYAGLPDSRYFTNAVAEVVVEAGAEVDHYRLQAESDRAFHVGALRVHQAEESTFSSRVFERSVGLGRYDLHTLLDGPNAQCTLNGLYLTSGRQHVDNYINIDHAKPHTTSRLNYKGILDDQSRAVFGGTVWVRKDAQKTDAQQSDKNLVLSPRAEVDSKPALFIYADDVKCGHGATAGNIDEETVFYMRSRGIDLKTASQLLIYGFAREIIDTVQEESLHSYLQELFLESLPSYEFTF